MKRISILITLIAALVVMPLTALALPVQIQFSNVGGTPIDITNTSGNVPGDPVVFSYDNSPASGFGTASITSGGITGDTGILDPGPPPIEFNNTLTIDFTGAPIPVIMNLLVTFSMPGMSVNDPFGVMADFFNLGGGVGWVDHVDVPVTIASPNGILQYTGPNLFDYVVINFSTDAPFFEITDVTYEPVPEPGTIILVAAGLLGLGGLRFARRKA